VHLGETCARARKKFQVVMKNLSCEQYPLNFLALSETPGIARKQEEEIFHVHKQFNFLFYISKGEKNSHYKKLSRE
jgi:hypothetical protein